MGGIADRFDDVAFGHYHQPTRITVNTATVRCAGSPESDNSYASESLAAVGRPSQPLMFVNPEKGQVTAEYPCVWLGPPPVRRG
jgi:DNA repair exonuclease SbcCD nuclease subunit